VAEEQGEAEPWGVSKSVRELSLTDAPDWESWALPAQWKRSGSPFALHHEHSTSSSEHTTTSGFKLFKDSCEAGSFTLTPTQVPPPLSCVVKHL
jgi:hypothetical protein